MTIEHADFQLENRANQGVDGMARVLVADLQVSQVEVAADPVEAYFECITTCSLDDGECVTTCTDLLREQM